jgi:dihydropteroate synthase
VFPSRPCFSIPLPDGRTLELGERPLVMAVVNVTPDSFSDGGRRFDPERAIADALRMEADGADVLDVGGESTRPGATPVPADEEWRRIAPVLAGLRGRTRLPMSVDTYKADVADRALAAGATMVNDVSGLLLDPGMGAVVARRRAAIVLMHHRDRSTGMYARAEYGDVVADVIRELRERGAAARAAGIAEASIIYDPGIGFAKRAPESFAVLAGLPALSALGRPLLSGPSRKSFLRAAIGDVPAEQRVWGTAAAVTASVLLGAHMVRVHDVREMVQVVRVAEAVRRAG